MKMRNVFIGSLCFIIVFVVIVFAEENGDQTALISFMSGIVSDPDNVLESWRSSETHMCNWTGIECNSAKTRVVQLDLSEKSLQGTISPSLANLSFLSILDLSENFFTGQIPREIGSLFKLKQLSFSSNVLQGEIPVELGNLHQLVYLNLRSNKFSGNIPRSLFCNGTFLLQYLDLSDNSLTGEIPFGNHCQLLDLRFLLLWSNKLVGEIPAALSNSSKVEWIDLESNSLSGELPGEIVRKMPRLQFLYLSENKFIAHDGNTNLSPFFSSLVNCSHINELDLGGNNLGGKIPSIIGHLSTNLVQINLGENRIYGLIPPSISNLTNLTLLNFSSNLLNGSIPHEIGLLRKLEIIYFSNNSLSGEIPSAFGDIPHLFLLDLSTNRLSGSIPDSLSTLFLLRRLLLHHNFLSGTIPPSLGNCINLEILDISHNRLSGGIPSEVAGRSIELYLNMSSNFLQGAIPLELSKMDMVHAIDLSSNNLSGAVPAQIGSCIALESLNLSRNILQGHFPSTIGKLPYLQQLDVSSNNLYGDISEFLQASSTLRYLNISSNNFSGKIPSEGIFEILTLDYLQGNSGICGSVLGLPSCKKKRALRSIILPVLFTLIGTLVICFFGYPLVLKSMTKKTSPIFVEELLDEENKRREYPRITYQQLVEATGGFNSSSLIGSGTFGHVYEGILQDHTRIAVKVLDTKVSGELSGSFKRECQVLKWTRHRNLIRIITACSRPDFKALVLPLMSNGSLESHLYGENETRIQFDLVQLVSICSDIAEGVAYLHHHAPVKVVHCDLKPSNILLDNDMTALVTDFGIAKLVKPEEDEGPTGEYSSGSTQGLLCGSIGYIAPEYGMGRYASTEGDVYSFGVLLLEFVTGKRPTDVLFHESLNLGEWVKSLYPYNLDPLVKETLVRFHPPVSLVYSEKTLQDVIYKMIELGLMCTHRTPSSRPSMLDVAHKLSWLKQYLHTSSTVPIGDVSY
ncbi:hypothetical protein ACHQM5_029994 [Ranunculus cassubicifolius]